MTVVRISIARPNVSTWAARRSRWLLRRPRYRWTGPQAASASCESSVVKAICRRRTERSGFRQIEACLEFCFATFSNLKEIDHEIETHQNLCRGRLAGSFRWRLRRRKRLLWQYRMLPQDVGLLPVSDAR